MPGKSEESLLLAFEPECRLWLWGDDRQGIAYIQADLGAVSTKAPYVVFVHYGVIAAWVMVGQYIDRSWFR